MKLSFYFNKSLIFCNCHIGNWISNNLIDYNETADNDNLLWINGVNNILLWDADEKYNGKGINIDNINCKAKIMMNLVLPDTLPSFYWSRDENMLNLFRKVNPPLLYNDRKCNSVFLGSHKDNYQGSFRVNTNWENHIEDFHLARNGNYKYNQSEYYTALANSKYGLCLRGGGPKCWREIEYLSLGTVLIVTEGVDVKNYHNPLEENIHYIKCNNPEDFVDIISTISEEKWNFMSKSCIEWYNNNCYFKSAIKILEEIVENNQNQDK